FARKVQPFVNVFNDFNGDALWHAIQRAIYIYNVDPDSFATLQRNGLAQDLSWRNSALGYQQLFEWAIARMRGW
ncbi:MAG TPA: hypothetical protein PK954_06345, partial [Anaerolineales bacterium]|nr:hypothetical protein [Anaerolineales bacterium]